VPPIFYLSTGYSQDLFFEEYQNSKNKNEVVAEVGPIFPKRKDNSRQAYLNYMINEKLLALDGCEKVLWKKEEQRSIITWLLCNKLGW